MAASTRGTKKRINDGELENQQASPKPRLSRDGNDLRVQSPCSFSSNRNVSSLSSPKSERSVTTWAGGGARAEEICCLLSCSKLIDPTAATARFRIAPGEAKRIKQAQAEKALIAWCRDGTCTVHKDCFQSIKTSVGSAKHVPLTFGKLEKSAVRAAVKQAEVFDSEEDVIAKAHQLADAIVAAKHACVFSGAGLSTAAGIGDYRGLKGKWTEEGMGADAVVEGESEGGGDGEDDGGVQYEHLRPTLAHEGISYLVSAGMLKYVISQNCDGLHGLSGVPESKLSELHGNVFREYCEKCGKEYERGHYVCFDDDLYYEELADFGKTKLKKPKGTAQCATCGLNHRTTRRCDAKACGGWLRDTIINFGDDLRDHIWDPAEENAANADLMVCFGSTLDVTPACYLAEGPRSKGKKAARPGGGQGRRVAIVNRQRTKLDAAAEAAGLRVFGDCDVVMRHVLLKLMGEQRFAAWLAECDQKRLQYDAKRPRVDE